MNRDLQEVEGRQESSRSIPAEKVYPWVLYKLHVNVSHKSDSLGIGPLEFHFTK